MILKRWTLVLAGLSHAAGLSAATAEPVKFPLPSGATDKMVLREAVAMTDDYQALLSENAWVLDDMRSKGIDLSKGGLSSSRTFLAITLPHNSSLTRSWPKG
jgi:hypothetical protein